MKVSPDGQYVYVADFGSGVRVYRSSNPLSPAHFFTLIQMDLVIRLMC